MTDPGLDPALAAALGALQGVAEFLPISSSGHLALAQQWLGINPAAAGHTFNIVVHAGTLLAVLLFYRRDLAALARAALDLSSRPADLSAQPSDLSSRPADPSSRPADPTARSDLSSRPADLSSRPADPTAPANIPAQSRALLIALIIGTLPLALALIKPVEQVVIDAEGAPRWIGAAFLITAALLGFSHRRRERTGQRTVPTRGQALAIGLAQLVAILPGISRSGSTMAAGLALGLDRLSAARYSFLLSIPAILGASAKESLAIYQHGAAAIDPFAFAVGFVVSFIVGTLTLRMLVALLVRVGLLPFVPYLIGLGLAVLAWS